MNHSFELPKRDPCPFCDSEAAESGWAIVDESESTFALVGPAPPTTGASLVITKRHVPTVLDLDDEEAAAVMHHIVRIARAVNAAYDPDGLNIFQNNGAVAYQSIPHLHVHVVPRFTNDGWDPTVRPERVAMATRLEIAEQIRRHLK